MCEVAFFSMLVSARLYSEDLKMMLLLLVGGGCGGDCVCGAAVLL